MKKLFFSITAAALLLLPASPAAAATITKKTVDVVGKHAIAPDGSSSMFTFVSHQGHFLYADGYLTKINNRPIPRADVNYDGVNKSFKAGTLAIVALSPNGKHRARISLEGATPSEYKLNMFVDEKKVLNNLPWTKLISAMAIDDSGNYYYGTYSVPQAIIDYNAGRQTRGTLWKNKTPIKSYSDGIDGVHVSGDGKTWFVVSTVTIGTGDNATYGYQISKNGKTVYKGTTNGFPLFAGKHFGFVTQNQKNFNLDGKVLLKKNTFMLAHPTINDRGFFGVTAKDRIIVGNAKAQHTILNAADHANLSLDSNAKIFINRDATRVLAYADLNKWYLDGKTFSGPKITFANWARPEAEFVGNTLYLYNFKLSK